MGEELIRTCEECGKQRNNKKIWFSSKYQRELCAECIKFLNLPTYPLPNKGEVKYTEEGKIICHICGKPFDSLGHHVTKKHNVTAREYRERFGLKRKQSLTSLMYNKVLQSRKQNENKEDLYTYKENTNIKQESYYRSLQQRMERNQAQFYDSCYIGIERESGKIDYIYCYLDGEPENVGNTLLENYTNRMIVENLIELGDFPKLQNEISTIKPYFKETEKKSIEKDLYFSDCEELTNNYRYLFDLNNEWMLRYGNSTLDLKFIIKEIIE